MKKLFILISIILLTSGCYDYKELHNLAIISGIAIDYDKITNEYTTTFEILNSDDDTKSYTINGTGKNIEDSFNNTSLKINKIPFYSHVSVMILSKSVINNNIDDLIEFIANNKKLTNTFYILLSKNDLSKDILESENLKYDTISESIYNLIDNKDLINNYSLKTTSENIINNYLNNMKDLYIPVINYKNNDIEFDGIAIFDNNKLKNYLNSDESKLINILLNESNNAYFEKTCNKDNETIINIYKQKIKYKFNKDKLTIDIILLGNLVKDECNYDNTEKIFNKQIKNDYNNLINKLKNNNSDILGINYLYYKNYNKKIDFNTFEINTNINLSINNNGIFFEVKK